MANWYVDIARPNDSGDGTTLGTAKKTVGAGVALLNPSDTLNINDGTYNAQILNTIPGGSSGNHTIIRAINRNMAILLPTSPTGEFAVINVDESYVTIDGLVTDATNCSDNGGYYIKSASYVNGDPGTYISNVIIKNGTAKNGLIAGSISESEPNGILLHSCSDSTIENMDIIDFRGHGIYCPTSNNTIDGNRIRDWVDTGIAFSAYAIQVYQGAHGIENNTVSNNVVENWQKGMVISSGYPALGTGLLVFNNVVYDCRDEGMRIRYWADAPGVYNNTIYGNGARGLEIDGTVNDAVVWNNICYGNGTNAILNNGTGTDLQDNIDDGTDPDFTNAAAGNFVLLSSSPAIDAATAVTGIFTTDFTGATRGATWDAGAYEFGAAGSPTVTTTTATGIFATTATSGGNVTADGGNSVTARGVCWSTSANPTTASPKTTDGTGTGSYSSSITGLSGSTLYHYRAYATNSTGTSYGADLTFVTLPTSGTDTSVRSSSTATGSSAAPSASSPSGLAIGDILIAVLHSNGVVTQVNNNGSTPMTEDLTDFSGSGSATLTVWSRRIVSGDPSTWSFTLGSSQRWTLHLIAVMNPHPTNIYNVNPTGNTLSDGTGTLTTATAKTITTTVNKSIHFAVLGTDGPTDIITSTPSGYSVTQNSGEQWTAVCTKVITTAGATGAQSFTWTSPSEYESVSFAIESVTIASTIFVVF